MSADPPMADAQRSVTDLAGSVPGYKVAARRPAEVDYADDDDLGRSGGGIARPGFERLLAAICDGRVGAVLAIEASRLARNGRDWHKLIEFCGLEHFTKRLNWKGIPANCSL